MSGLMDPPSGAARAAGSIQYSINPIIRRSGGGPRGGQEGAELFEEAAVLLHGADGDADPFGEAVGVHIADDDAFAHEGLENGLAVADFDEDEIGVAGDVFEAEGAEFLLEEVAAYDGEVARFALVLH